MTFMWRHENNVNNNNNHFNNYNNNNNNNSCNNDDYSNDNHYSFVLLCVYVCVCVCVTTYFIDIARNVVFDKYTYAYKDSTSSRCIHIM